MTGPRMRDVARRAGVSIATVSRVMSGDVPVSHEKHAAVQSAIEELGYVRLRRPPVITAHARRMLPLEHFARWIVGLESRPTARRMVTMPIIIDRAKSALKGIDHENR